MRSPGPRIVIDARPLSHPQNGGFKAYVRSLLRGFQEIGDSGDPVRLLLYLDRPLLPGAERFVPTGAEVRVVGSGRLAADLFRFAQQVRRDRPDLVHGTVNYLPIGLRAPATLTLHDALGIVTYSWSSKVARTPRQQLMAAYWRAMTKWSVRMAQRIITVSHGAAEELAHVLGLPRPRFVTVYNGITLPETGEGPRPDNVILAIASSDQRKNLDALYRALSDERRHFDMVPVLHIVCTDQRAANVAEAKLKERGVQRYRLLHGLDDNSLANAYAQATVFAWPSWREGFGMPPLEAMRAGCPVVSSTAPVMPEILGSVPRYFDPARPDELAGTLNDLLQNRKERRERSEQGRVHSRLFTCRRMAEETLAVWRNALAGRAGRA